MKYDLIVVGTGFASSFFLKKYLEKSPPGKKVLVLERGQLFSHPHRISREQGKVPAYQHLLENHEDSFKNRNPEKPWRFDLNFGGSSNCWWGCTPRFMPNDFALKSLYNQGMDWPLTYNDLEQYYTEVEELMGIAGPENTPFPKSGNYPLPPHAFSSIDKKMHAAYGEMWIHHPTARASRPFGARNQCCSSYSCSICPVNAKFTIENGLGHLYKDPRVELKYGMQVIKIDFENGLAKRVVCTDPNNRSLSNVQTFEGEVVALGANAIFNPHILLNSGDTNQFTGAGIGEQRAFYVNAHIGIDNLGGSSAITANGYMEYDGAFRKESASCLIENHNAPVIRNERGKWRKILRFKFVLEDIPDLNNRVKAGDDPFKPVIEFKETGTYLEKGRQRIEAGLEKLLAPLPVEEILIEKQYLPSEAHILCSARMGNSAKDSVVDKNQLHHQYRNLFVLGGSSFTTMAAANPTITISALSLKAADASF